MRASVFNLKSVLVALLRRGVAGAVITAAMLGVGLAHAQPSVLPAEVEAALSRAKVPRDAMTFLVVDAEGRAPARLSYRANVQVNPASVMKLVTTMAALDTLGPTFVWTTPVYLEGLVRDGTLFGKLYIKGQGDPKLVMERVWLLLRRVQGLGIKTIAGDIVLDRSAFETAAPDPGDFDGERLRPYNATPDALLLNYKSLVMTFVPERQGTPVNGTSAATSLARVNVDPPLAGVQMQATVPLAGGECGDYRSALKADLTDPNRIRFLAATRPVVAKKSGLWPMPNRPPLLCVPLRACGVRWVGKSTARCLKAKCLPG